MKIILILINMLIFFTTNCMILIFELLKNQNFLIFVNFINYLINYLYLISIIVY